MFHRTASWHVVLAPVEEQTNPTREYVKELLWAALMINLIVGLVGLWVGVQLMNPLLGLGLFLGGGLIITGVLALLVLANAAVVWFRARR